MNMRTGTAADEAMLVPKVAPNELSNRLLLATVRLQCDECRDVALRQPVWHHHPTRSPAEAPEGSLSNEGLPRAAKG